MSKFFVKDNQIEDNVIKIVDDVNHIKNVLRLEIGNKIIVCNENTSKNYECEISEISKEFVKCKIINEIENDTESNIKITIFQGLPKAEKMELIIQKSTELGATEFVPVNLKRCIVKISGKDEQKKIERWQKIAEVAAKQSGRDIIPKVSNLKNLNQVLSEIDEFDLFFTAYENEKDYSIKQALKDFENIEKISKKISTKDNIKVGFLIGPEGGLDQAEVETLKNAGAKVVTLGKRILRTETVALSITSIVMYELEDFGGNK
jgi:16S rRNA (uracil1498-N3)-methyltransferase